jgi:hypothetical protein
MTAGQEFQKNNTIRLKGTFRDFSGDLVDPTVLAFKIFDATGTAILTKAIGDLTRESLGVYHYDWQPTATGDYIYEFSGTLAGSAMLAWDTFSVEYHI